MSKVAPYTGHIDVVTAHAAVIESAQSVRAVVFDSVVLVPKAIDDDSGAVYVE